MIRVAINGFGRIGRNTFKAIVERGLDKELEVVAVNDLTDAATLAHLLKYDTVFGRFAGTVDVSAQGGSALGGKGGGLVVNGKKIQVIAEKDPAKLPWKKLKIDVVLECTGRYTKDGAARAHITAGAKRVIVSAPAKGGDVKTFVLGVNDRAYKGEDVISNASCTTNCVSPVTRVINDAFGIERAALTTIHAVTAEQNLVDGPPPGLKGGDLRRARAAYTNMVPTTSGATIATTEAIPELKGKFDGLAVRVPVIDVSLSDFVFVVKRAVTKDEVNDVFRKAAAHPLYRGVLAVTDESLVSSDFIKSPYSAIVDLPLTTVIDGTLVKVMAWYDNEWGYSCRLAEMAVEVGKSL